MAGYEKRIVYFDLIEKGEKIQNAGFAKLIIQNGQIRLMLQIKGLHKTDTIKGELLFLQKDADISVDYLSLQAGQCVYSRLLDSKTLRELQVEPDQLYGLCVKLGENRMLRALWAQKPINQNHLDQGLMKREALNAEELNQEQSNLKELNPEESNMEQSTQKMPPQESEMPELQELDIPQQQTVENVETIAEEKRITEIEQHDETVIFEDKWKQLEQNYPVIHPFRDDRAYLSIAPKDFIVLTREYQTLATNSFLLHGFYNYHHIILGKVSKKGDELFYIGVPGVFYEREKAVALMFGFESFECEKEPARTGELGYYMKRVNI